MKTRDTSTAASQLVSKIIFRPMPYEVDFTGFLSNTVAPRWMEDLRVNLMDQHFPRFDNDTPEHLSVIAETQIKYLKPARYSDVIVGHAWVASATFAKWVVRFAFDFQTDSTPMLEAKQTGAFLDPITFLPVRIPDVIRKIESSNLTT